MLFAVIEIYWCEHFICSSLIFFYRAKMFSFFGWIESCLTIKFKLNHFISTEMIISMKEEINLNMIRSMINWMQQSHKGEEIYLYNFFLNKITVICVMISLLHFSFLDVSDFFSLQYTLYSLFSIFIFENFKNQNLFTLIQ